MEEYWVEGVNDEISALYDISMDTDKLFENLKGIKTSNRVKELLFTITNGHRYRGKEK